MQPHRLGQILGQFFASYEGDKAQVEYTLLLLDFLWIGHLGNVVGLEPCHRNASQIV